MCYRKRSARDLPLKAGLEVRDNQKSEMSTWGILPSMFRGSGLNPYFCSRSEGCKDPRIINTLRSVEGSIFELCSGNVWVERSVRTTAERPLLKGDFPPRVTIQPLLDTLTTAKISAAAA